MLVAAREVADAEGIGRPDRGYRLVFNVGPDALNSVPHLHLHVVGGRALDVAARVSPPVGDTGVRTASAAGTGRDPGPAQPPHGRAARPARRAAAPDRGGLPRRPASPCGATRSPSTAPTPSGWPGSSTSWCSCSSRASASTPAKVARTIDMVREDLRPSEVLNTEVAAGGPGPDRPAQDGRPEALHRRHRRQHRSPSASARPGPASRTWPWPWPSRRSRPRR